MEKNHREQKARRKKDDLALLRPPVNVAVERKNNAAAIAEAIEGKRGRAFRRGVEAALK